MALLRINGELVEFSKNTTMLTLTDAEYDSYPNAKNYLICITESRMIINHNGIESIHDKPLDLLAGAWISDYASTGFLTKSIIANIDLETREIERANRYDPVHDRTNEYLYSPYTLRGITYRPETDSYCRRGSEVNLEHIKLNNLLTHLYKNGDFLASAYRSILGDLTLVPEKIVKCVPYEGHLLAKYENDDQEYLLLTCYSSPYSVLCDIPFPSTMTKSARK